MNAAARSYLKVQYELRPCKQVERRMLIDALHLLSQAGFPIRDYQYTGFGSIYFVDFILLHKYLGIERMVSLEHDLDAEARVKFNKPYSCVQIEMAEAGAYVPKLPQDLQHLLWLDYDVVISRSCLEEVLLSGVYLTPGSVLLVTLDAEPPGQDDGKPGRPAEWCEYYVDNAREYLGDNPGIELFTRERIVKLNVDLVERAIKAGLTGRDGLSFAPLFCFQYADGTHQMLTVGGMICGDRQAEMISLSGVGTLPYIRLNLGEEPFEIRVPKITRKERLYLDAHMPCRDDWKPRFKMPRDDVLAFRSIYRFFPPYAELAL